MCWGNSHDRIPRHTLDTNFNIVGMTEGSWGGVFNSFEEWIPNYNSIFSYK